MYYAVLEYARVIGAQVINASWSFPADGTKQIPLLQAAINRFCGWVVCAAGKHRSVIIQTCTIRENPLPLGAGDHYLYPACYSPIIDKVITVTTVTEFRWSHARPLPDGGPINSVDIRQVTENRASAFVDVGAIANAPLPGSWGKPGIRNAGLPAIRRVFVCDSVHCRCRIKLFVPAPRYDHRQT